MLNREFVLRSSARTDRADRTFDLVRLSFVLHRLSDPEAALREAARLAPRVLITDWKLPERNLDYLLYLPLLLHVRCLRGRESWKNFRRFMLQGGAEGLIRNMGQSRSAGARLVGAGTRLVGAGTRLVDAGARLVIVKRSFLRCGSVVRLEVEVTA
jgi:hypothetical protein